ncbi:hypothetical protein FA95DRAFT_630623 [Auriscalpium vulgare]|uniref:Uncharacterized protein n=1 Tax=Auriscalpium vulgare TaxID=40419 RepID=A0ACB8RE98_9AGAM|nr:hypothetical protein FA95DRAFT_630623 [Auriscalpium vulgare]
MLRLSRFNQGGLPYAPTVTVALLVMDKAVQGRRGVGGVICLDPASSRLQCHQCYRTASDVHTYLGLQASKRGGASRVQRSGTGADAHDFKPGVHYCVVASLLGSRRGVRLLSGTVIRAAILHSLCPMSPWHWRTLWLGSGAHVPHFMHSRRNGRDTGGLLSLCLVSETTAQER